MHQNKRSFRDLKKRSLPSIPEDDETVAFVWSPVEVFS